MRSGHRAARRVLVGDEDTPVTYRDTSTNGPMRGVVTDLSLWSAGERNSRWSVASITTHSRPVSCRG